MAIISKCALEKAKEVRIKKENHAKIKRILLFLKNEVKLGDEIFTDIAKIKARSRKILATTKDWEKINSPDDLFVLDLLKHHKNYESKTSNMDFITAGKSEHDYSRCFFVMKKDGSKEDFSIGKCIDEVADGNKKGRK